MLQLGLALALAISATALAAVPVAGLSPAPAPVGNVTPALEPVPSGKVAVAAASAPVEGKVAVVVQNASTKPVKNVRIVGTATSADGGSVVGARTAVTLPAVLAPGTIALAALSFRGHPVPPGATIAFKVRSTSTRTAADPRALPVSRLQLSAPLTGAIAQKLDLTITNPSSRVIRGRLRVVVMCFDEARKPSTVSTVVVNPGRLRPGSSTAASVPLTTLCPTYLVAARRAA